jgi:hypothetical protein
MTLFGTVDPTLQELLDIRNFYPEGCDFFWSGQQGQLPEISLILFREHQNVADVCKGCRARECEVRLAPNPNLNQVGKQQEG